MEVIFKRLEASKMLLVEKDQLQRDRKSGGAEKYTKIEEHTVIHNLTDGCYLV